MVRSASTQDAQFSNTRNAASWLERMSGSPVDRCRNARCEPVVIANGYATASSARPLLGPVRMLPAYVSRPGRSVPKRASLDSLGRDAVGPDRRTYGYGAMDPRPSLPDGWRLSPCPSPVRPPGSIRQPVESFSEYFRGPLARRFSEIAHGRGVGRNCSR